MPIASGTFCQKIQRQDRWSVYQPSRDAEMLSDTSRLSAYTAIPYAHALGGVFRRTKLSVRGMKKPEASPPRNWKTSNVGRSAAKGSRIERTANAPAAPISALRVP